MKKQFMLGLIIMTSLLTACQKTPSTLIVNNEEISINSTDKNTVNYEKIPMVTMLNEDIDETLYLGDVTVTLNGTKSKPNTLEGLWIYTAEIIDYTEYEGNMLFLFGEYKEQVNRDFVNHLSVRADDGYSADIVNSNLYDENDFAGAWGMLWFYEQRELVSEEEIVVNMTNEEAKIKADEIINQIGATSFEYDSCKYNKDVLQITPEGTLSSPTGDTITVNYIQKIQGVPLRSTLLNNRTIPNATVWFDSKGVSSVMITEYECKEYGQIEDLLTFEEALEKFKGEVGRDNLYNGAVYDNIKFEYAITKEYIDGKFLTLAVPCWHFYSVGELDIDIIINCMNGEVW